MKPIETFLLRGDKLARRRYGFVFDPESCELVLSYYYEEDRPTPRHRWTIHKQWSTELSDILVGGITLEKIKIPEPVVNAVRLKFAKQIGVRK